MNAYMVSINIPLIFVSFQWKLMNLQFKSNKFIHYNGSIRAELKPTLTGEELISLDK